MTKLLEKAKKLKAIAERGTEHEAAVAATKLAKLCIMHGLNLDELSDAELGKYEIIRVKRLVSWKKLLLSACAQSVGAYAWIETGGALTCGNICCYPYQKEVIEQLFKYLCTTVERMARSNITGQSARNSYKLGMTCRLYDRLVDLGKWDWADTDASESAIVHVSSSIEQARAFALQGRKTRKIGHVAYNSEAYHQGKADANKICLAKQIH